jgi:outer membrane lipopolysaccharide assembly protein LptE/RlpB
MRIFVLLSVLALGACGFKPSNVIDLSYSKTPFSVSSNDPFSGLADNIERALSRAGVRIAESGEPANSISISQERIERNALSFDRNAQVTEYTLRYRVTYSLTDANGKTLIDSQIIELRRDFNYDVNISSGSPAEEALLKREMQAEMVSSILRRTGIVLHSQTE